MTLRHRLAVPALLLLLATPALGGGPGTEEIRGHDVFAKGRLEGLALDAEGVLRPGPGFETLALEAETAWCHAGTDTALWVGLGNKPAVWYVHPDRGARHDLGEGLMVSALAGLPGEAVAAAVFPGGRVLKVTRDGKVTTLARLPVEHVWAMTSSATGVVTAACGVPGTLYRIDPLGGVTKLADVDDSHARCLARSPDGATLYVGTSPKGRVLAWDGEALKVVRDLEPQEVVGIVAREDGSLIVAANADEAGGNAQRMASLLRRIAEPQPTKKGEKPAAQAALQDGVILHLEAGGAVTTLWEKKKTAVLSLAPDGEGAVAGTYPSARLIGVAPGRPYSLLADLPEAEASVVFARRGRFFGVVTSNPAVLHGLDEDRAGGTWTSAPIDAGARARWGRLSLWGRGVKGVRLRAGPTSEPDAAWSAWRPLASFDGEAGTLDVSARFVQVEVALEGAEAELRGLSLVRRTPNQAPVVSDLAAEHAGRKKDAPPTADSKRKLSWKPQDADGDRLRTTVAVNRKGSPHWTTLVDAEVLAKPEHVWDTKGFPDGVYQVRVTVADAPDNEPGRARSGTALLTGVRVDNTPPTVTVEAQRFSGGRLRVAGLAADTGGGRVLQVRVSLDGGAWLPLAAKDGLYDSGHEPFEGFLRIEGTAAHDVVVQVTDADGNMAAAATVVR